MSKYQQASLSNGSSLSWIKKLKRGDIVLFTIFRQESKTTSLFQKRPLPLYGIKHFRKWKRMSICRYLLLKDKKLFDLIFWHIIPFCTMCIKLIKLMRWRIGILNFTYPLFNPFLNRPFLMRIKKSQNLPKDLREHSLILFSFKKETKNYSISYQPTPGTTWSLVQIKTLWFASKETNLKLLLLCVSFLSLAKENFRCLTGTIIQQLSLSIISSLLRHISVLTRKLMLKILKV